MQSVLAHVTADLSSTSHIMSHMGTRSTPSGNASASCATDFGRLQIRPNVPELRDRIKSLV